MLELRIVAGQPAIPLFALPATIGRAAAAQTVGDQIEAMMALLDQLDGDPDLEDNADLEPDHDREVGYTEWHTRERRNSTPGGGEIGRTADLSDDDEDDDPAEDDDSDRCAAGDDMMRAGPTFHLVDWRPPTAESWGHEPGCEDDAEPEDRAALREQIRWIRGRACVATVERYSGGIERTTYRLIDPANVVAMGVASDLLPSI